MHGVDADPDVVAINPVIHMSSRRGWARLGEQFRPRVRAHLRTFFPPGKSAKKPLETLLQQLLKEALRDQDLGGAGHRAELECQ